MGKIIAFANQKGGVAKTTSTYNVGVSLARKGKRVLMVDLDSQASLTISAGLEPYDYDKNIVVAMSKNSVPVKSLIQPLQNNLFIITSRIELARLEIELIGRTAREMVLKKALEGVKKDYDFILVDCPPQLSILTVNAFSCADYVIIPVKTEYLAYRGLGQLQETIQEVQENINPTISVLGVIATMYEQRVNDDKEILQVLEQEQNVIGVVKRLAIVKRGVYGGLSVAEQSPNNDVAKEYDKISDYIIEKCGAR